MVVPACTAFVPPPYRSCPGLVPALSRGVPLQQRDRAYRSLREEFLTIAKAEPERCAVIDASRDVQHVADEAWTIVRQRLKL